MGCGVSSKPTSPASLREDDGTWATKTNVIKVPEPHSIIPAGRVDGRHEKCLVIEEDDDRLLSNASSTHSASTVSCSDRGGLKVSCSDRGGLKVSCSDRGGLKAHKKDLPEWHGSTVVNVPKQTISKQQQEEAARLAETRKKFDNQRYKNPAISETGAGGIELCNADPSPAAKYSWDSSQASGAVASQAPALQHHPAVDNLALYTTPLPLEQGTSLPGGILEDELLALQGPLEQETANQSEGVRGFDADDEALMREILEELDTTKVV